MPTHNPECTHGGAHAPSECRDRYARHLKPLEDPISVPEASNPVLLASELTDADREALKAALAGLAPWDPAGASAEPNWIKLGAEAPGLHPITAREWNTAILEAHDLNRDPDADADAAQRAK